MAIIRSAGAANEELSLRGAKRRSNPFFLRAVRWIASRSLSSGAHSREPVARNGGETYRFGAPVARMERSEIRGRT
jgi:hypothetical protein